MSVVEIIELGGMRCKWMKTFCKLSVTFIEHFSHGDLGASIPHVFMVTGLSAAALKIVPTAAEAG